MPNPLGRRLCADRSPQMQGCLSNNPNKNVKLHTRFWAQKGCVLPCRFVPGITPGFCPAGSRPTHPLGRRASAEFSITLNLVNCPCMDSSGAFYILLSFPAVITSFLCTPRHYITVREIIQEKFAAAPGIAIGFVHPVQENQQTIQSKARSQAPKYLIRT